MNSDEARAARLAAIRAKRGTPERQAAVATIEAAKAQADPQRPEGELVRGFACELRAGDYVVRVGGTHAGRSYKRYLVNDVVDLAGQTARQRTRGHVVLRRQGDWLLHTWYPVEYIRPTTEGE